MMRQLAEQDTILEEQERQAQMQPPAAEPPRPPDVSSPRPLPAAAPEAAAAADAFLADPFAELAAADAAATTAGIMSSPAQPDPFAEATQEDPFAAAAAAPAAQDQSALAGATNAPPAAGTSLACVHAFLLADVAVRQARCVQDARVCSPVTGYLGWVCASVCVSQNAEHVETNGNARCHLTHTRSAGARG